jgi:hypothetical protein
MDRAHDRRSWTRSPLIYTDSDTPSPSCLTRARVRTRPSRAAYVAVAGLPVVSVGGVPRPAPPPVQEMPVNTQSGAREVDVFATIEKLAQLHAKGILSDEEFAGKKADLLSRL